MGTITVRVTEEEKEFLNKMAKFKGENVSEMMRNFTLEAMEDSYDIHIGDLAYEDYLINLEKHPLSKLMKEYEI